MNITFIVTKLAGPTSDDRIFATLQRVDNPTARIEIALTKEQVLKNDIAHGSEFTLTLS